MKKVVITGLGMVTPVGNGKAATWSALKAGKCGIGRDGDFAEHRGTLQVYSQGKDDGSDGEHRISYRGGQNLCDDRRGILRGSLLSDDECQRTAQNFVRTG